MRASICSLLLLSLTEIIKPFMKRRSFIKKSAAAGAAFSIVPSYVLGGVHTAPSDTLYIGAVGVGGRGAGVVNELFEN